MHMKTNPSNQSLEDLLLIISWKEDDKQAADAAFSLLYKKYFKYLRYICAKFRLNGADNAEMQESILNDVFMTVYEKASQLLDFRNGCPEEEKDKMFRAWMGKTARHLFLKIADEYSRQFIDAEDSEADSLYEEGGSHSSRIPRMVSLSEIENFDKTDEPETVIESKKLAEIKVALDQLDEREQEIILLYANFEDEDGHSNLPNYLRNSYAEKHQILPDSVRKTRQRALKKLKSKLNL